MHSLGSVMTTLLMVVVLSASLVMAMELFRPSRPSFVWRSEGTLENQGTDESRHLDIDDDRLKSTEDKTGQLVKESIQDIPKTTKLNEDKSASDLTKKMKRNDEKSVSYLPKTTKLNKEKSVSDIPKTTKPNEEKSVSDLSKMTKRNEEKFVSDLPKTKLNKEKSVSDLPKTMKLNEEKSIHDFSKTPKLKGEQSVPAGQNRVKMTQYSSIQFKSEEKTNHETHAPLSFSGEMQRPLDRTHDRGPVHIWKGRVDTQENDWRSTDNRTEHRLVSDANDHVTSESSNDADRDLALSEDGTPFLFDEVNRGAHKNDFFMCPPCKCYPTGKGAVVANCTFRHLNEFPSSLPQNTVRINLTSNRLKYFNVSDIAMYPRLKLLDLSHNNIEKIFSDNTRDTFMSKLASLQLNNNKISEIEAGSFRSVKKLRWLKLKCNSIVRINSTTFLDLDGLLNIDLSWNKIISIHPFSFDPLSNLDILSVNNNNNIGYVKLCQPRMVQNLTGLQVLRIQGNSINEFEYPNEFLGQLRNLKSLSIDVLGRGAEYGQELANLKKLKYLRLGPYPNCWLKNISSTFFQHVPYLEHLIFDGCKSITFIDPRAFYKLPSLMSYSLKHVISYDLEHAFESLGGLQQNSSLMSLQFVGLFHGGPMCRTLGRKQGEYLQNLSLQRLDLSFNRLALLGDDFLTRLPKTLIFFNLENNKFPLAGHLWSRLYFLRNLQTLILRNQNVEWYYNDDNERNMAFYKRKSPCRKGQEEQSSEIPDIHTSDWNSSFDTFQNCDYNNNISREPGKALVEFEKTKEVSNSNASARSHDAFPVIDDQHDIGIRLISSKPVIFHVDNSYSDEYHVKVPPNLEEVSASLYMSFGNILFFDDKVEKPFKLWYLDFSNSFLTDLGHGHLPAETETLDLSNNHCNSLSLTFFLEGSNLTHLYINKNYLSTTFNKDENGELFKYLAKLRVLDISFNSISSLPDNFFRGLHSLQTLIVRDNKLQTFKMNVSFMTNLSYIDARANSISWIDESVRRDLDRISSHHILKLDLTENAIPCTCQGIEILEWMSSTKVKLMSEEYIRCSDGKGNFQYIGNILDMTKRLEKECTSYLAFITGGAAGGGGIILSVFLAILIYKRRWHIMYSLNNNLLIRLFGFKSRSGKKAALKFDAYVVYEEDDRDFVLGELLRELETKRGHALCVEDRDFIPGTLNFNNIVSAVQNSSVTVFVVSPDFVRTNDFDYAIQMALIEEYNCKDKRDVCKMLLYRPTPFKSMPRDLQMLLKKGRFLEFPQCGGPATADLHNMHANFWNVLSQELGHGATACPTCPSPTDEDESVESESHLDDQSLLGHQV